MEEGRFMQSAEYPLRDGRTLVISRPKVSDAENLLAYLKQVGGETDFLLFDGNGVPFTLEMEQSFLAQNLQNEAGGFFCGFIGGDIAATFNLEIHPRERMKHNARLAISVPKKYWGIGVGSAVMRYMFEAARVAGFIKTLRLEVRADNARAIALYEKFGFREIGRHKDGFQVNGLYYDEILMDVQL